MKQAEEWDSPQLAGLSSKLIVRESDKEALRAYLECGVLNKSKFSREFNPIAFSLVQFDWAVIGHASFEKEHLTYRSDESEKLRKKEFTRMLGVTCNEFNLRAYNLLFYCKSEWGSGGRGHIHFLIGSRGTEKVTPVQLASTMHGIWANGPFRRGGAQIEPFQKEKLYEAVLYQTKHEFDASGNRLPVNELRAELLDKEIIRRNSLLTPAMRKAVEVPAKGKNECDLIPF
jgi:hypothetical protein